MTTDDSGKEAFLSELRTALQHLYDPAVLRDSLLLAPFGLDSGHDPIGALRRHLLAAIQTLKPPAGVPLQSEAWRIYHVLTYR